MSWAWQSIQKTPIPLLQHVWIGRLRYGVSVQDMRITRWRHMKRRESTMSTTTHNQTSHISLQHQTIRTVKIWDYTTKSLIATLEGHTSNVSFACYHPELPVIISGSEDGTVKIWHANTYRLEQSLNYGLERAWCVSYQSGKQGVAVGFDDGAVVVRWAERSQLCRWTILEN